MDRQVEELVRYCLACQDSTKAHKLNHVPEQPIPKPQLPWSKGSLGHLRTIRKRTATSEVHCGAHRPPHKVPRSAVNQRYYIRTPHQMAATNIRSLWKSRHTIRQTLSDNGPQMVSEEMENFLASRDIKHETTAVYNPQQNGMVESFNRYLKHGVQTFSTGKINFENGINELLFSYRATSPTPETKSPGELMFHRRMRTTYQPAMRPHTTPASTNITTNNQPTNRQRQSIPRNNGPYKQGEYVRTKLPHTPKGHSPFSKPHRIAKVLGDYTYRLDNGQVWNARKLVRLRLPPPRYIEAIWNDEPAPQQLHRPRRSTRSNRGQPPLKYMHSYMY